MRYISEKKSYLDQISYISYYQCNKLPIRLNNLRLRNYGSPGGTFLLITYYLLLITYHLLLITYYLLLTTYHLLLTTYYLSYHLSPL